MKKIKLFIDGCFVKAAHFDESGDPDQEVIFFFGTHILDTAYLATQDLEKVKLELQQYNQDLEIL